MTISHLSNADKCPHCLVAYHDNIQETKILTRNYKCWIVETSWCPSCKKPNLTLRIESFKMSGNTKVLSKNLFYPHSPSRSPVPQEVPESIAKDYNEACLILGLSPKASAALSRRCLQQILREHAGTTQRDLAPAIQQIIDERALPPTLLDSLDAIRNIGNFAAHPIKSTSTGEILEVEPGEAEWNLDILEELFDYYFVLPVRLKAKRDALNARLAEAGKPAMKGTSTE